jgi:membrane protein implicated in regulation of membrane protease activity
VSAWVWWVVAAVVFAVAEMAVTTLFIGPFAIGALAAGAADLAGAGTALEVAVFLVGSGAAFTIVRPIARRHLTQAPAMRTGTSRLIGEGAVVLEEVTADGGSVKLEGEVWTARSYDADEVLPVGARVNVIEIRGATALVAE